MNKDLIENNVVEIRTRFANGERRETLAEEFHVNPAYINLICSGVKWPNAGGPITLGRRSQINNEDRETMKQLRYERKTDQQIADIFGISRSYVTKILNNKK